MPTVAIDYVIRERGAAAASRNVGKLRTETKKAATNTRELDQSMRRFGDGVGSVVPILGRLAGIFGVALSARALVQTVDSLALVRNRLKIVTADAEQADAVFRALQTTAQETGGSFDSLAATFVRIANATKDFGRTAQESVTVTKALSQAAFLAGATTEEATAAIIQFSQGLASGRLQGDELRSVLEQLPNVGRAISRELGIAFGRIREEARAGRLSTQELFDALLAASEQFQAQFDETASTVGQSINRIGGAITALVDEIERETGAIEALAAQVEKATAGVVENLQTGTIGDAAAGTALEAVERFNSFLGENLGQFLPADNPLVRFFIGSREVIRNEIDQITDGVGQALRESDIKIQAALDRALSTQGIEGDQGPDERLIAFEELEAALERQVSAVQDSRREIALLTATTRANNAVSKEGAELTDEETDRVRELAGAIFDANVQRRDRERIERDAIDAAQERTEAIGELLEVLLPLEAIENQLAIDVELINEAQARGIVTGAEYAEIIATIRKNAEDAKAELADKSGFEIFEQVGVRAIGGLADAIVDFTQGGKDAFRSFASSLVKDLLRIIVQLLIVKALQAAGGAIGGGVGGALVSIAGGAGRQQGGRVQPGSSFVVGEAGPEIFRPDTAGSVVPNQAAAAAPAIEVQIVNVDDATQIPEAMSTREGEAVILNVVRRNRGVLRELLA